MSACACAGYWLMWPVSARVGLVLACVALMLVAWEAPAGFCGWCCLLCSGVSICGFCWLALACVACAGLMSAYEASACWLVWLRVGLCHHYLRLVLACVACVGMCLRCLRLVLAGADLRGLCWPVCLCGLCWPVWLVLAGVPVWLALACATSVCGLCWPDVSVCGLCWPV